MKRIFLVLTLIFFFGNTYSQTKKETQEWIADKLQTYAYSDEGVTTLIKVDYNDTKMIIENNMQFSKFNIEKTAIFTIPIAKIDSISFKESQKNISMTIHMRNKHKSIYAVLTDGSMKENLSETAFILSNDILKEDLVGRFKKAFKHLIDLYGGNTDKEVF